MPKCNTVKTGKPKKPTTRRKKKADALPVLESVPVSDPLPTQFEVTGRAVAEPGAVEQIAAVVDGGIDKEKKKISDAIERLKGDEFATHFNALIKEFAANPDDVVRGMIEAIECGVMHGEEVTVVCGLVLCFVGAVIRGDVKPIAVPVPDVTAGDCTNE